MQGTGKRGRARSTWRRSNQKDLIETNKLFLSWCEAKRMAQDRQSFCGIQGPSENHIYDVGSLLKYLYYKRKAGNIIV